LISPRLCRSVLLFPIFWVLDARLVARSDRSARCTITPTRQPRPAGRR
jgi:hypothetical protein